MLMNLSTNTKNFQTCRFHNDRRRLIVCIFMRFSFGCRPAKLQVASR